MKRFILSVVSQILPVWLFIDLAFFSGNVSAAKTAAVLTFYIVTGPVFYYILNGKVGDKRKVVFGIEGKEVGPYAGIQVPKKALVFILVGASLSLGLAAIFDYYGI